MRVKIKAYTQLAEIAHNSQRHCGKSRNSLNLIKANLKQARGKMPINHSSKTCWEVQEGRIKRSIAEGWLKATRDIQQWSNLTSSKLKPYQKCLWCMESKRLREMDMTKYWCHCKFHQIINHLANECFVLLIKIQYMINKKKILQKAQTSFHVARWSMPATNSFNKLLWPQDGLISLQLHQPRRSSEIKPINDNFRRNIITINVNAYDKFPLLSSTSSWVLGHLEKKKAWYDKKYQLNSGSVGSPYKTDPMCISSHDPAKNITEVKRLKVLLCMRWKYWTFSKAQGYKAQIHDQVQKTP